MTKDEIVKSLRACGCYIEREAAVVVFEERQKALCPVGEWSRNKAYDREKFDAWEEILDELRAIPAADVAPVVHGRWVTPRWHNSDYCYNCSKCGGEAMHREYQWARNGIYPICPNCGAKMDGGTDDETG